MSALFYPYLCGRIAVEWLIEMNRNWETVIGLEVHVELATRSKIFCACSTEYSETPNTHCCPICMGLPGTLPVLNAQVLDYAIKAGLVLNCVIEKYTRFDRKNYFYPDLPKAFQISQLYRPIAHDGYVEIDIDGEKKRIRIREMHMEEDAGKLIHSTVRNETYPDYNRCGVPLLEIVSEPDFRSPKEVSAYLEKIKMLFSYLGIADFKMQEGSMRADVNLSIRKAGSEDLGTRTEMKNINSIAAIVRAIESEASRQIDLLNSGKDVVQETRHWNDDKRFSYAMRSKENAQDYRYFPEPDLPPVIISDEAIENAMSALPEFMDAKEKRFVLQYGLSEGEATMLSSVKKQADLYEAVVLEGITPKVASNWFIEHISRIIREEKVEYNDVIVSVAELAKLIAFVDSGKVNRKEGLSILRQLIKGCGPENVEQYIKEQNLIVSYDTSELLCIINSVIDDNKEAVLEYYRGKEKVIGFLVGQVMNRTKGKYNPTTVKDTLLQKMNSIQ